ncbi:hypothetical protein CCANI_04090 [Corynebacterium canis]|nr:hypothetical protein CCANI_04090 [Corynebacterium canis]
MGDSEIIDTEHPNLGPLTSAPKSQGAVGEALDFELVVLDLVEEFGCPTGFRAAGRARFYRLPGTGAFGVG